MQIRKVALMLMALALSAAGLATTPAGAVDAPIQPGAVMNYPAGCTLNVIATDGSRLYVLTAGHCTEPGVGQRVGTAATGRFGTVVDWRNNFDDYAVVLIDESKEDRVSAEVRGWGVPTGVATRGTTAAGDLLGISGYGMGFSLTRQTREDRVGVLVQHTQERFYSETPAIFGDSGGPVVHAKTGRILGIVSGIVVGYPPNTLFGTTVERALDLARVAGYDLTLVTA